MDYTSKIFYQWSYLNAKPEIPFWLNVWNLSVDEERVKRSLQGGSLIWNGESQVNDMEYAESSCFGSYTIRRMTYAMERAHWNKDIYDIMIQEPLKFRTVSLQQPFSLLNMCILKINNSFAFKMLGVPAVNLYLYAIHFEFLFLITLRHTTLVDDLFTRLSQEENTSSSTI